MDGATETVIEDATSASYTVVAEDLGTRLKVAVSFTDDLGFAETVSSTVPVRAADVPGSAPRPRSRLTGRRSGPAR